MTRGLSAGLFILVLFNCGCFGNRSTDNASGQSDELDAVRLESRQTDIAETDLRYEPGRIKRDESTTYVNESDSSVEVLESQLKVVAELQELERGQQELRDLSERLGNFR